MIISNVLTWGPNTLATWLIWSLAELTEGRNMHNWNIKNRKLVKMPVLRYSKNVIIKAFFVLHSVTALKQSAVKWILIVGILLISYTIIKKL